MIDSKRVIRNVAIGESSEIKTVEYQTNPDDFLCGKWLVLKHISLLTRESLIFCLLRYFKAVLTVVGIHFGHNIQRLQLMNLKITLANLADLLSFCGNLKMLFLYFVNENENDDEVSEVKRFYSGEALPKVSDVVIYECGDSVLWILSQLPKDSIKSLTIKTKSLKALKDSLSQQRMISKFNLISHGDEVLPEDFFDHLELTHLTLKTMQAENLSAIIARNPGLISLDVGETEIDDKAFMEILQLPHLEKLIVDCSNVSRTAFTSSLTRTEALKSLSILSNSAMHFEVLNSAKSSMFGNQVLKDTKVI